MTEPAKYPFDYDALNKGDVITVEFIEGLCNLPRTDHKYGLKLMSYQQQIQNELALRGKSVVVRCDHGALRILTDSEAAEHTAAVFNQRKRQMVRAHASAMRVDTGKLTDEQKISHERNLLLQGAQLAAMKDAKKKMTLAAHERKTPGIAAQT
jgi:hypothetical protein